MNIDDTTKRAPHTAEFIAEQLRLIQAEQREQRTEMRELRAELKDLAASQTVLTEIALGLWRDMVQIKDMLGRMDSRIAKLEGAAP